MREGLDKLGSDLILQYRQFCTSRKESEYDIGRLLSWLQQYQIKNLQKEKNHTKNESRSQPFSHRKADTLAGPAAFATEADQSRCPECMGRHPLAECTAFLKRPVNARRAFV